MARIFVAGATGYLGSHVVREAHARGYTVRALARDAKRMAPLAELVHEPIFAEATAPGALEGCCDGVDLAFTSLGITRQTDRVTYEDVDYRANRAVLDECLRAGVPRLGFVSVLHGDRLRYTDMVDARERLVDELRQANLSSVVLRPTGFFADLAEVFHMAKSGRAWVFGDGSARLNPIHGADLAAVVLDALEGSATEVEVGGPDALSQRQIAELAFEVLGRAPRVTGAPLWLVDAALPAVKLVNRRWWNIAAFLSGAGRQDMVAPAHGTHTLRAFYEELRDAEP